jgi:hypothetical protein
MDGLYEQGRSAGRRGKQRAVMTIGALQAGHGTRLLF